MLGTYVAASKIAFCAVCWRPLVKLGNAPPSLEKPPFTSSKPFPAKLAKLSFTDVRTPPSFCPADANLLWRPLMTFVIMPLIFVIMVLKPSLRLPKMSLAPDAICEPPAEAKPSLALPSPAPSLALPLPSLLPKFVRPFMTFSVWPPKPAAPEVLADANLPFRLNTSIVFVEPSFRFFVTVPN